MNHLNELIIPGKVAVLLVNQNPLEKAMGTVLHCPVESLPKVDNEAVEMDTPHGPVITVKLGWWDEVPSREKIEKATNLLRSLLSSEHKGKTILIVAAHYRRIENPGIAFDPLNYRSDRMVVVADTGDYALVIRNKFGESQKRIGV